MHITEMPSSVLQDLVVGSGQDLVLWVEEDAGVVATGVWIDLQKPSLPCRFTPPGNGAVQL